jgi:hypothetical protein
MGAEMRFIQCGKVIWLTERSSTYCMREMGHPGECNIENKEPEKPTEAKKPEEAKAPEVKRELTPEELLIQRFGPYSKDDPIAHRGF